LVAVEGLRPRQVLAASLLVQGRRGKDVAAALGVSAETVSRWRQLPEFQALMHRLLQETIDTARLGIVALCAESIEHLRGLIRSFDDDKAMNAIALVLGKAAPVLGVIGTELRRPPDSKTE
jgi:Homeodomain-like domain